LRILGGDFKGKKLKSIKKSKIRPTSARAKTSIFDVLKDEIEGKEILDLYAGSGALGIEALCRGADFVTFVDSSHKSTNIIKKNIEELNFKDKTRVFRLDSLKFIRRESEERKRYDIIFCDPPYQKETISKILDSIAEFDILNENGIFILEHHKKEKLIQKENLELVKEKRLGDTVVSFFIKRSNQ